MNNNDVYTNLRDIGVALVEVADKLEAENKQLREDLLGIIENTERNRQALKSMARMVLDMVE